MPVTRNIAFTLLIKVNGKLREFNFLKRGEMLKWVLERQTFKTLSRDSGLSIDTLQRTFYTLLQQSPKVKILKRSNVHLRMDATYFEQFCLLCYQDHDDDYTQLIRFSDGEHYDEIKEDLKNLIKLGLQIEKGDGLSAGQNSRLGAFVMFFKLVVYPFLSILIFK